MRRLVAVVLVLLTVASVGVIVVIRREAPQRLAWTEAAMSTREERAAPREFTTADSVTITGWQVARESRGTIVLLWGTGDVSRFMTRAVGRMADLLNYHVIGVAPRGTSRSGYGAAHAYAFSRDIAAVIGELKRREPSGPVILMGVGAGAGLVGRYLEDRASIRALAPDALILLHPVTDPLAMLRTPAVWRESMEVWPRRLWIRRALAWVPSGWLDRLRVAAPVASPPGGNATGHPAGALLALAPRDPWRTWRDSDVPILLLTSIAPDSARFPRREDRAWRATLERHEIDDAITRSIDEFLAPFAEAAAFRVPVPGSREVPILPP